MAHNADVSVRDHAHTLRGLGNSRRRHTVAGQCPAHEELATDVHAPPTLRFGPTIPLDSATPTHSQRLVWSPRWPPLPHAPERRSASAHNVSKRCASSRKVNALEGTPPVRPDRFCVLYRTDCVRGGTATEIVRTRCARHRDSRPHRRRWAVETYMTPRQSCENSSDSEARRHAKRLAEGTATLSTPPRYGDRNNGYARLPRRPHDRKVPGERRWT